LAEQNFDDLALLASFICQTPIAQITLIDRDRQWFRASVGMSTSETQRNISFYAHAILDQAVFVVPDTTKDKRFQANPPVTGNRGIRSYAGVPCSRPKIIWLSAHCASSTRCRDN